MPMLPRALVALLTFAGCVTFEKETDTAATATAASMSGAAETTGEPASGSSTGETVPTTSGAGSTGEVAGECDVWAQDCLEGSKCVPFDSMHTGVADATKCVEVADPARQAGDPCAAEGGVVGADDCDAGLLCWFLDDMGKGVCTPMCSGAPLSPSCEEGLLCDVSNGGLLPLCLTKCDPLATSCPMGQICIPSNSGPFVCDSDASGDGGAYGDPCEYINVCDPGLLCSSADNVPGCSSPGCCTEYCDTSQPADGQCSGAPAQVCIPWFTVNPPPGLEDVGLCGIKQ